MRSLCWRLPARAGQERSARHELSCCHGRVAASGTGGCSGGALTDRCSRDRQRQLCLRRLPLHPSRAVSHGAHAACHSHLCARTTLRDWGWARGGNATTATLQRQLAADDIAV